MFLNPVKLLIFLGIGSALCACQSTARCPQADINCDHIVNGIDVAAICNSANFGKSAAEAGEPRADVNGDGQVNGLDVAVASSLTCFAR